MLITAKAAYVKLLPDLKYTDYIISNRSLCIYGINIQHIPHLYNQGISNGDSISS